VDGAGAGSDVLPNLLSRSRAEEADTRRRTRPLGPHELIDPNRASEADLDRLPGVGPSLAAAIVADRKRTGPFQRAEELTRVAGLGEGTLARIRPHLDLAHPPPAARRPPSATTSRSRAAAGAGGRAAAASATGGGAGSSGAAATPRRPLSPVDVNRADEATLQTLPGVGPVLARRIVESRRQRPFVTLQDLARVKGIGPAALGRLRDRVTLPPGG